MKNLFGIVFILDFIFGFVGCKTTNSFSKSKVIAPLEVGSGKEELHYQKEIYKYEVYLRNFHFYVNTNIDFPTLKYYPKFDRFPLLYRVTDITGVFVAECTLNTYGRLSDCSVKKTIGLGLDKFALGILNDLRFEPAYILDKKYNSRVIITLIFEKDEDI